MWISGAPVFATVDGVTGIVTGLTAGFVTISYSMGVGCMATKLVSVNPLPSAITGPGSICDGSTIMLSASGSGTWSSGTPTVATTGVTTGAVTGISSGTSVITYTIGTGCQRTKTITVDPLPAPVTGLPSVCVGSSITLSDVTSGGAWSCSPHTTGSITPVSGIFTGIASGVASVTYTIAGGCKVITTRTVNPLPASCTVTGGGSYCLGGSGVHLGLGCSSADARYQLYRGATAIGTPITGTGFALDFGLYTAAGSYTVIATNPTTGCTNNMTGSAIVAAYPLPAPIVGPTALCAASVITLTNASAGGTWSGSNPGTATIGATTGIVTGIATGTTTISYTLPTGCKTGTIVTVSLSPGAISGPSNACPGFATVPFTNSVSGGVWTSGTTSVAMIGSLSGIVTGVATGTTIITYSLGSGCTVTKTVSVTPLPGSITGSNTTCVGSTTMLSNPTPMGRWSSGSPGIATVGSATGIVSGISPGTSTIYYTLGTGCAASTTVTVNPVLSSISGTQTACVGATTLLSNPIPGGTWSSGNPVIATVGSGTGIVTGMSAGTAMITYTLSAGCDVSIQVTINPLPAVPTGAGSGGTTICIGGTTTLTDATPGGTWSTGTPAIATIGSATGIVNGLAGGAATISYTIATGCVSTAIVTVVDVPPIAGVSNMCAWGDTILISNAYTAGLYGSSLVTVLNLGGGNGLVTAFAPGVATISYTLATIGCVRTATLTINPLPGHITGMLHLCAGATTTLGNTVSGGAWSSSSIPVATIVSTSGYLAAITTGTTRITYALPTGCKTDTLVSVSTMPNAGVITGPDNVCTGQSIVLTDSVTGGTWHSSSAAATVAAGIVTGVSAGTNTISYTVTNLCGSATAIKSITINPMPDAGTITGIDSLCVGNVTMLINTATGGVWSCTNPSASISTSGVLSGLSPGMDTVLYTVSDGDCTSTAIFPVKILPLAVCGSLVNPNIPPGNTSITIYPNPNDGVFVIKGSLETVNDEEVSLEITNMTGQVVYKEKLMATNGKLDAQITTGKALPNGVYLLTMRSENVNKVAHIVITR